MNLTSVAHGLVVRGSVDGVVVPGAELRKRVSYLCSLVSEMAQVQLSTLWDEQGFALMHSQKRISQAWTALSYAQGLADPPEGVHVSSRIRRMASELAGRQVRGALHRQEMLEALLADPSSEVGTLAERRIRLRQIAKATKQSGRAPTSFWDLEPAPPVVRPQAPLNAGDRQLAAWIGDPWATENGGVRAILLCHLPLVARPTSKKDWAWHELEISLPPAVLERDAKLCRPTLRLLPNGQIAADSALEEHVEKAPAAGPVFGLDWGLNPLLTGSVAQEQGKAAATDGRVFFFSAKRWLRSDQQRRVAAAKRRTKAVRLEHLASNCNKEELKETLLQKAAALRSQAQQDENRRRHANRRIAEAAAAWSVAQATALQCRSVAAEDLGTLTAGGMGKRTNVRLSQAIRGELQSALERACVRAGLHYKPVPAGGTSSDCSRCGARVEFHTTSESTTPGYHWMHCPNCKHSADRNANASTNIGARFLGVKVKKLSKPKAGAATAAPAGAAVQMLAAPTPTRLKMAPKPRRNKKPGPSVRARRRACRGVTPPRVRHVRLVQRSAGPGTEGQQGAAQSREAHKADMVAVSARDGMRFALRHSVKCSPVRQLACTVEHR